MKRKIILTIITSSFLFASPTLTEILIKAKETNNLKEKKALIKKSFKIKPTMYAVKMLIEINKSNPQKVMNIIQYAYDIFPLNKYLTLKGIETAYKIGALNKAEFFLFNYLKTYPLDKDILYQLAIFFEKKGKITEAERVYKTIYKLYGDKKAMKKMENIAKIFE